ncbi:hypothetical protein AB0873_23720 [Micromonospora sp. NPDC047707]|uniref:hypothetical protein n=1 Tax=unclassified Micromonospora TaxID=2617518 RepID=UPI0012B5029C|nr:hypothetical protein [Micromonospora sp. WMMC415]QGN47875.1 hypothetical protein GKC29_14150 [Micromonospora sp. WMMC415]
MLASVPWIVVLSGVVLLVVLLVMALLSFRGSERHAAPPPAPPLVLPTPAAAASAYPSPAPASATAAASPTASASATTTATRVPRPTRTRSTPPATASSPVPPSPLVGGGDASAGQVTARYEVTDRHRDSFEAELVVRNRTGEARDWRVELTFTGDIDSFRVYGRSGVSVSAEGGGRYVLRGTGPVGAGEAERFHLWISHDGADTEPDRCTVNDADCVIE